MAERKVEGLSSAGARVTVLSPTVTAGIAERAERGQLTHWRRRYGAGDLRGFFVVCAAADDEALHREIAAEAAAAGVLLNVVDSPALCTFVAPAVVRRGALTIAISTGGASPALASRIRRDLEARFGPEYGAGLALLGALRSALVEAGMPAARREEVFTRLAASPLLDYLRVGRGDAVDGLLQQVVGPDYSRARLGLDDGG